MIDVRSSLFVREKYREKSIDQQSIPRTTLAHLLSLLPLRANLRPLPSVFHQFRHLLHRDGQILKCLFHADIVLGTGLGEQTAMPSSKLGSILPGHFSRRLNVTSHQHLACLSLKSMLH